MLYRQTADDETASADNRDHCETGIAVKPGDRWGENNHDDHGQHTQGKIDPEQCADLFRTNFRFLDSRE